MTNTADDMVLNGFRSYNPEVTKEYFYGYCRRAYAVFDHRYQLRGKVGLDFYSLAHEYYIQLMTHDFKQLEDRPKGMALSTWMAGGFRFVVLDALKSYNKEFEIMTRTASDDVLQYVRSSDKEEGMLFQVVEAVASHYHDRKMQEIAHMILYAGYKQNQVAEMLGITPAAVNQKYKKMMEEVVVPYVIENYGGGIYAGASGAVAESCPSMPAPCGVPDFATIHAEVDECESCNEIIPDYMQKERITPEYITSLQPNEIFVFGSNIQGIHAGGAARTARLQFGAVMGNGVGIQGQSYAIPTMQGGVDTIKPYVDDFINYAREHKDKMFLVTPIGCGIAGFEPDDIAPLFKDAISVENISLPEDFWDILEEE